MAGYVSDSECIRYRMNRDMGYDRLVYPKHQRRYGYRDGGDIGWLFVIPFAIVFGCILWMMLDPANWWMW